MPFFLFSLSLILGVKFNEWNDLPGTINFMNMHFFKLLLPGRPGYKRKSSSNRHFCCNNKHKKKEHIYHNLTSWNTSMGSPGGRDVAQPEYTTVFRNHGGKSAPASRVVCSVHASKEMTKNETKTRGMNSGGQQCHCLGEYLFPGGSAAHYDAPWSSNTDVPLAPGTSGRWLRAHTRKRKEKKPLHNKPRHNLQSLYAKLNRVITGRGRRRDPFFREATRSHPTRTNFPG